MYYIYLHRVSHKSEDHIYTEKSAYDVTGLTTRSSIKARIAFEAAVLTISNMRIRLKKSWA